MFGFGKKLENAKNCEWGFKPLSPENYRILICFQVESEWFKKILKKNGEEKLAQTLIPQAEEIKTFGFNEQYLKLSKTYLSPAFKEITKHLEKEGIVLYNIEVTKDSKYNVIGDLFHVYFVCTGQYGKR